MGCVTFPTQPGEGLFVVEARLKEGGLGTCVYAGPPPAVADVGFTAEVLAFAEAMLTVFRGHFVDNRPYKEHDFVLRVNPSHLASKGQSWQVALFLAMFSAWTETPVKLTVSISARVRGA